ncbi:cobyrinic acid a,c-diamide synthase [Loktanella sp. D2R18]|uniref:cobyrinate a,c-diamide synthase n=1 Tax=Rhodobacterales TaxID=204455 RepID=UPI000DE8C59B|nr:MULTISPECIES: cobyrinate a,c-diamide synthase [Rhodobacterales]MDO6590682.1 cobyrinate a,c-diamide synthase [Yoonia sp. 1_MG-2023]RBW44694.1 cobyrinic acid a,c-diamide synthase [Loktanella sp. D2R18]
MSFVIAAPASGSGKTTVTLGLLRAISRITPVRAAKSGPDYIDPQFHAAACGTQCVNLDAWAMTPARISTLAAGDAPLIVEGAMGLFDGAPPDGKGATADIARILGLPVILVIDAGRMAGSVAAVAQGFMNFDPTVQIAGVILNNVGSPRHETMLRRALGDIAVFGAVPRTPGLTQPSRHLGLVQAQERPDLDAYLDAAADLVSRTVDIAALLALGTKPLEAAQSARIAPPAQNIAVARDAAFAFCYPHLLDDWRAAGAKIAFFSPLVDDPAPQADYIYLPGGYPELYAGKLAANTRFLDSLRTATAQIYGECGGYMVLGNALTDADGETHKMAGLLSLQTSFATRKLHLGYRDLWAGHGPMRGAWKGHEFHYATTVVAQGTPLFQAKDAEGQALPEMGLMNGNVSGSFAHIIDAA